jgi:hypothetical protein
MAAGIKTGGRQKGTPNKATVAKQAQIAASGLTPLDFMLAVLRDEEKSFDARMDAAKAAAPYCHPKRAPVDSDGEDVGLTVIVNKP